MKKTCGYKSIDGTIYESKRKCRKKDFEYKRDALSAKIRNVDYEMSKYINLWRNNRNMIDSPTQALCRLIYHGSRELLEYKIESDKLQKEYEDLKDTNYWIKKLWVW